VKKLGADLVTYVAIHVIPQKEEKFILVLGLVAKRMSSGVRWFKFESCLYHFLLPAYL
jgi:hypothetical protein